MNNRHIRASKVQASELAARSLLPSSFIGAKAGDFAQRNVDRVSKGESC